MYYNKQKGAIMHSVNQHPELDPIYNSLLTQLDEVEAQIKLVRENKATQLPTFEFLTDVANLTPFFAGTTL